MKKVIIEINKAIKAVETYLQDSFYYDFRFRVYSKLTSLGILIKILELNVNPKYTKVRFNSSITQLEELLELLQREETKLNFAKKQVKLTIIKLRKEQKQKQNNDEI